MNRRSVRTMNLCVLGAAVLLLVGWNARGEELNLPATRDVWICGAPGRRGTSMSKTHTLALDGTRDLALMDFDRLKLHGKKAMKAELFLHRVENVGEDEESIVTVSTVSSEWVEGRFSVPYREDPIGRGATFNQASYGHTAWAGETSTILDVVMGKGNTLQHRAPARATGDGWWKVELSLELVHAVTAGASHGLCVTVERKGGGGWRVHSLESGVYAPYLRVQARAVEASPPVSPAGFEVTAAGSDPARPRETLGISFVAPKGAFSYDVTVDHKPVPRRLVPFAAEPGAIQRFTVPGIGPRRAVRVMVWAVGSEGGVSDAVEAELPAPAEPDEDQEAGSGVPPRSSSTP